MLDNSIIEEISVSRIKEALWNFPILKSDIKEKDKDLSWDGFIQVYDKANSESKKDFSGRVPVQVKGKVVKKISSKFHSFSIDLSDLKNYLNDGGVIFFVVEIKEDKSSKIFYKMLLPVDLNMHLDEAIKKRNTTKKSIKIDKILDGKSNFDKECIDFLMHKKLQSSIPINGSISINDIKSKSISILGINNPFDLITEEVYGYAKDEFDKYIPLISKLNFDEICCSINKELVINHKKYFDNYKIKKNDKENIIEFGDRINLNCENKTIKILESKKDICERLRTVEFFIENTKNEGNFKKSNIDILKEEIKLIKRIIDICNKFDLDKNNIKICNMTERDLYYLEILEDLKVEIDSSKINEKTLTKDLSFQKILFFDYQILVAKVQCDDYIYYVDYSSRDSKISLTMSENKHIEVSRFLLLNSDHLLLDNINKDIIIESINDLNLEDKKYASYAYTLFALENIKAWDESKDNMYLDIAKYIFEWLKEVLDNDILIVNLAQIELRYNDKLNNDTIESLYRLKFSSDKNEIKAAICIIIDDKEGFDKYFNLLNPNEKSQFKSYPIYNMYLNHNIK